MVRILRDTLTPMLRMLLQGLDTEVAEPMLKDAANDQIHGNIANIANRKKPDGSAQKANAPSTVARKGHDIPLRDSGQLTDPSLYTTVFHNSRQASVYAPMSRWAVLGYLDNMEYEYWEVLDEIDGESTRDRMLQSFIYHFNILKDRANG